MRNNEQTLLSVIYALSGGVLQAGTQQPYPLLSTKGTKRCISPSPRVLRLLTNAVSVHFDGLHRKLFC